MYTLFKNLQSLADLVAVEHISTFLQFLPECCIAFLDNIFLKIRVLKIVHCIQTKRPVVISKQAVEICYMLLRNVQYALCLKAPAQSGQHSGVCIAETHLEIP